jgi:oligopeptide/dipeptide ABC transporter ATP-binding protein
MRRSRSATDGAESPVDSPCGLWGYDPNTGDEGRRAAVSGPRGLLRIEGLKVHFRTDNGIVRAVDGVDLAIREGETLAVVGESGSGKSVTSLAVMGLLPRGGGTRIEGRVLLEGDDLLKKSPAEMRRIRGERIAMIFQEPMTSLNPVYTVGWQIAEAVWTHQEVSRDKAFETAVEMLDLVGIPEPRARLGSYPHQLSGGMRQRVMIAIALACRPRVLIADEPTTALDVTIQAQILDLMRRLQREIGMSILFITHDLAVVAEMADRVVVMYTGRAVEQAEVRELFRRPRMPYTMGLMRSIPTFRKGIRRQARLPMIPGSIPNPLRLPHGCTFHPRCPYAVPACTQEVPALEDAARGHLVRCLRWREVARELEAPAVEAAR